MKEPGAEAEVDFGPVTVELDGQTTDARERNRRGPAGAAVSHSHNAQPSEATATGSHSWPCVS